MKYRLRAVLVVVSVCSLPAQAGAQEVMSFAELETAGAKRMTGAEIKTMLEGKVFHGKMGRGYETEFEMKNDGEFVGAVFPPSGRTETWGTWRVEEDAYCMDMNYQSGTNNYCNSIYKHGDRIFVGARKPKPDSKMNERFVKAK